MGGKTYPKMEFNFVPPLQLDTGKQQLKKEQ